ncbi:hypothetical protein BDW02DRAFT_512930 [Decorospora gaudefroyi]|uniref:Actin-like ATPase domain-containing protein n=1 Tax=Decorospora gaudefroyi TaxID=184978 RepID=A0A6A5JWL7_9PLEO|nr:hypothetical protein BDW02DRAFT_512930 [Decorospora gaudefroyi]
MFSTVVAAVTESLSATLGYHPRYSAIFLPRVFNQSTKHAAMDAVFTSSDYDRDVRIGFHWQSACEPFDFFHRSERLGRAVGDCNEDGPESSIVVLEYEEGYLHASLVGVMFEWEGYASAYRRFCRECGASFQMEIGVEAHTRRIITFLSEFFKDVVFKDCAIDEVRAIVLAGGAPSEAFVGLENLVRQVENIDHVRILKDIDPGIVSALGAALWAVKVEKDSDNRFVGSSGMRREYHDEL